MVASTSTIALSSSIFAAPSKVSSHKSFAPQAVRAAPSIRRGVVTIRASASEEPRAVRKELLAGLVAAGAALVVAGSSFAAAGPGTDGAAVTAQQARELLQAGDDVTNNESPPRYGGERVGDQASKNAGSVASQAGAGIVGGLQNNSDAGSRAIETAKENVEKAGERFGDLFKKNKTSGNLSTSTVEDMKGGRSFLSNEFEKVKPDIYAAGSKVKSGVASTQGLGSNAGKSSKNILDKAQDTASDAAAEGKGFFGSKVKSGVASSKGLGSDVGNKSKNFLDKAQDTASNAAEEGKGVFGDIKNKITESIPK